MPLLQAQAPLSPAVAELIQQLGLQPHPEGGYYKETFRDERQTEGGRAASTAILYLLPAGAKSKLHRIDASECWHAYLGGRRACGRLGGCMLGLQWATVGGYGLMQLLLACSPRQASLDPGECACASCADAGGAITVVELDSSAPSGAAAEDERRRRRRPAGGGAAPAARGAARDLVWRGACRGHRVGPGGLHRGPRWGALRPFVLACLQLAYPALPACWVGMCICRLPGLPFLGRHWRV